MPTGAVGGDAGLAVGRGRLEGLVFTVATVVILVHVVDDAILHRQPGVGVGQHALAATLALVAGLGGIMVWARARPGIRAALALVFGALALVNGGLHVAHIEAVEVAASDVSGVLAAVAGVALVGLGLAIPVLHRGEGAWGRRRRWVNRVVAVLAGLLVAYVFLLPVGGAVVLTHKHREPIGPPPSSAYESVTFDSSDGLSLSGWYVRSSNRAAVVLVHGGGGDRTGAIRHAELLARHGYGVLLYDSRGRGRSEGSPNAFGWGWEKDVAGAIDFLSNRSDIDPGRIGGLGLSTGADVLIEVATERRELRAIVSDGATARSFADYRNEAGVDVGAPFFLSLMTAVRVLSGSAPGEPLEELVGRVSPTPLLLIAAGRGVAKERDFNELYAKAAREPVELWDLPDVNHTDAISELPAAYEQRVIRFFDEALVRPPTD